MATDNTVAPAAKTSNEKLHEALKLLEEAAIEKRDDLKVVIGEKYSHLKDVVIETEGKMARQLAIAKAKAAEAAAHAKEVTAEKAKVVDEHVHANPWPYIGGAAVAGLLLGYILGRSKD